MSDELLYVASEYGKLPRRMFLDFLSEIAARSPEVSSDSEQRYGGLHTERAMESMGHIDVAFDHDPPMVYVGPRLLVQRPQFRRPVALLVGNRSPHIIEQLAEACDKFDGFLEEPEKDPDHPFIPLRVMARADTRTAMEAIAQAIGARYVSSPAAWDFVGFSCSLSDYLLGLSWSQVSDLNWPCRTFDPDKLSFRPGHRRSASLQLMEFEDPRTGLCHFYIRQGVRTARAEREWARYAVLEGRQNVIGYTEASDVLVPIGAILPRLLARALCLSSGCAPAFLPKQHVTASMPETVGYYCYRLVPRDLAEAVARKLAQHLVPAKINR